MANLFAVCIRVISLARSETVLVVAIFDVGISVIKYAVFSQRHESKEKHRMMDFPERSVNLLSY